MTDLEFLTTYLKNKNLVKHCIAVKAIMEALAEKFGENKEKWGTTGLFHDVDVDLTLSNPAEHSIVGANLLKEKGYDEEICRAIKVHNEHHGIEPVALIEKALYVSDPLSGLITASVLVLPSKKLSDLKPESVVNRFYEKSFAKGAKREIIGKCKTLLNIELDEFCRIGLTAMQSVSDQLGL